MAERKMDEALTKAKAYSRTKHHLIILEVIWYTLFFTILQSCGLSFYIAGLVLQLSHNYYLSVVLYIAAVGLMLQVALFPIDLLSSYKIEHRFNLSKQTLLSWFMDYCKRLLIGGCIYSAIVVILYYFLRTSPSLWWAYAALIYFIISVVLAKVFPIFIIPLFYKLQKVSETPLKRRLILLAQRAGVKALEVYNIALGEKTKKANAALCGWGITKRILLSDTLLAEYSVDEIESALAHELAHYKHRHFWKLSFYHFVLTLLGFYAIKIFLQWSVVTGYIRQIYDISIFPILALLYLVYNVGVTPLLNFISRRYESEADSEAVKLTNRPEAFVSLMRKLTLQNLSDPQPSTLVKNFFYDHPPAEDRIRPYK